MEKSKRSCKVCGTTEIVFPCRECVKRYKRQIKYIENREQILAGVKSYQEKNIEKIAKRKHISYIKNREEILIDRQEYAQKNAIMISERNHNNYIKNREKVLSTVSNYQKNNRAKINNKRGERYNNDPLFKLRKCCSSLIKYLLKDNKNGSSILLYLPYTILELKFHIEIQFSHPKNLTPDGKTWMTWSNWGRYNKNIWDDNDSDTWKWQLDHIIPQSALLYTSMEDENFKKCWALENLRPLSAKDNILKRNKLE